MDTKIILYWYYNKMKIDEKTLGKEYYNALLDVLKIRAHRRKFYKDEWLNDPIENEVWQIYNKTKRITIMSKDGDNEYEKLKDSVIDNINYSLFLLAKLNMKEQKE